MDELAELSEKLGNPAAHPLWLAARRAGLDVTKPQVRAFTAKRGERQIFGAPQPARGKTAVPTQDNSFQMDLADLSNSPGVKQSETFKYFLIAVNAFDRMSYAVALKNKDPNEVKSGLQKILNTVPVLPKVISSDNGAEFQGDVSEFLTGLGIVQRFKAVGDLNALGVVDRAIQTIKRKIAELAARSKQTWPALLPKAVSAVNATPKPGTLLGDAPEEVRGDREVRFQLQQRQARNFRHNQDITQRRQAELDGTKTFRPQLAVGKFKRGHQATYGDVTKVREIQGGIVTDTAGKRHDLKRIRIVPADSTGAEPNFGDNTAGRARKRVKGAAILDLLEEELQGVDQLALSTAAIRLRARFKDSGQDYDDLLSATHGRLIDLIRVDGRFAVEERKTGVQSRFYVALV